MRIDQVVTRGGDKGETSLGDGSRVGKHTPRIAALGDIDEANAVIGIVRLHTARSPYDDMLARVQNDLFDAGADLCVPGTTSARLRVTQAQVTRLEQEIAAINADLPPLTSFVLPGGTPMAAYAHLARTVVRRAERGLAMLIAQGDDINPQLLKYINRLSDFLFVLARAAGGPDEGLWRPGAHIGA